jgi:hypothetical protein
MELTAKGAPFVTVRQKIEKIVHDTKYKIAWDRGSL